MSETLTKQQMTAINDRGGKLLVSAAAGSGKTKVLVDRLLQFITDPLSPANIDEFLIITYTKAAAAELRGKIAAKLTELIAQDPANRHLQQQIQRLYLAKISTVHAFCADILREYAYKLDISADFRVADENECIQLQEQVLENLLETVYDTAAENSDFCAFIDTQGFGRDDRQIPQIVLKVYNSARCHIDPEKWLDWCVAESEVSTEKDAGETVWGAYLIRELQAFLTLHIEAIDNCLKMATGSAGMEKPVQLLESTIVQLQNLRDCDTWESIVQNSSIDFGRLTFSKKCTDLQLVEQIKAIRNACKKGLEKKLRNFCDSSQQALADLAASAAATRGLVGLVRQFSKEYTALKQRRRVLDFGDLEHKMLDLLLGKKRTGRTAAAMEIEDRFCQIMVDEYQDSNEIQDAIFTALTEKRQNCFMVGDVKQSIYQFRLADPEIFIKKYNSYLPAGDVPPRQGRKVLLSSNFRSSGGVISAVNHVFHTCMSERVGGLSYGQEEQLYEGLPHISIEEPEVELYGVAVQEDTYAEEAAFVADRICQLLDGTHMVRDKDVLRPIQPDDIVILLRSPGSIGGEYRFALESRGIQCNTGDSVDLLQTEEIGFLRSLLQVICNPLQDIPLITVLTSRVFCFTADDLAIIRGIKQKSAFYDAVTADQREKSQKFISVLTQLRQYARYYSLPQLLDRIFEETNLLGIYSAMSDGDIRSVNIQAFYQILSDFDAMGQKDLVQFLDYLDAMEERGLGLSTGESKNSVTIMSIHKSKGLEFPVVFLCGLSRNFNQESVREQVLCHKDLGLGLCCVDSKLRVRYPNIAKRAIASKILADGISEEMRVLYVAMTRARDRLIMTYAANNLAGDLQDIALRKDLSSTLLMTSEVNCPGEWVLQTALGRTEAGEFFHLSGPVASARFDAPAWHIRVVQSDICDEAVAIESTENCQLDEAILLQLKSSLNYQYPYLPATMIPSKQTATQLKGRLKDQEAAENTASVRHNCHVFRKPAFFQRKSSAVDHGNAYHAVMQHIDLTQCDTAAEIQMQLDILVNMQFLKPEYAQMVDPDKILRFFSTDLGRRIRESETVRREFKFSLLVDAKNYFPETVGEKILLQGVVDCFMIEDDGITVVDFKTDRVTSESITSVTNKYREQVSAYALALERIFNTKIKKRYLYFFDLNQLVEV